jgi:four helix bundle protein
MAYTSEQSEVWNLALEYTDQIYGIAEALPDHERYGLASQMREAANSIALDIAEESTGLSDTEQNRFLRMSTRSLIETVGTPHLVQRQGYIDDLRIDSAMPTAPAKPFLQSSKPSAPLWTTIQKWYRRKMCCTTRAPF